MAWLVSDARVLASAEVADTRRARRRGLLGRDGLDGALVIERCRWIHTIGMRFPIDVAYVGDDGIPTVLKEGLALLPGEVIETAINVNQQMLDVMTAGAAGKP